VCEETLTPGPLSHAVGEGSAPEAVMRRRQSSLSTERKRGNADWGDADSGVTHRPEALAAGDDAAVLGLFIPLGRNSPLPQLQGLDRCAAIQLGP